MGVFTLILGVLIAKLLNYNLIKIILVCVLSFMNDMSTEYTCINIKV